MSVVDISTRKILDAQAEYAEMEADFAFDRRRIARKLFDGSLPAWDQTNIDNPFAPDLRGRHCVLCGGTFPIQYKVKSFWSLTDPQAADYSHRGCYTECESWTR